MKKLVTALIALLCLQSINSQTWVRKLDGISMWSLGKDFSGNIYAGASGSVKSIYKSTNGGENWAEVLSGGTSNFLSLACDSLGNVYAGNISNGLMKSTNGGLNWTNVPVSVFNGHSVESVACGRNGYVYAGCISGGVFRSTDYGATFPVNVINTLTIVTLAVDKFNPNIIYAGASSGSPPNYGFYVSTDAGLTFGSNLNPYNIWGVEENSNGHLYTITTSAPYPFHKSTNGGLNWTAQGNLSGAMRGLCMDIAGNFYTSGNGGVFKSTNDGVSFTNFNFTYTSNQILCFQNKILVAASGTSNGGVYIYSDSLVGTKESNSSIPRKSALHQNYPNPFNPETVISYDLPYTSGAVLEVFDVNGKLISLLVNEKQTSGTHKVKWDGSEYPSGVYFYKLTADQYSDTRKMVLIK
jgi:Secretion system C-terminal sorting domain